MPQEISNTTQPLTRTDTVATLVLDDSPSPPAAPARRQARSQATFIVSSPRTADRHPNYTPPPGSPQMLIFRVSTPPTLQRHDALTAEGVQRLEAELQREASPTLGELVRRSSSVVSR